MSKVEIKLNIAGLKEFRNSQDVVNILQERAEEIQQKAGEGFVVEKPYHGKGRANVAITTETAEAYYKNMKENTLLKALS